MRILCSGWKIHMHDVEIKVNKTTQYTHTNFKVLIEGFVREGVAGERWGGVLYVYQKKQNSST